MEVQSEVQMCRGQGAAKGDCAGDCASCRLTWIHCMAQLVLFFARHHLLTILHHNMITLAQWTWLLMETAQHNQQEIGHGPSADSLLLQLLRSRSLLHFEFSSLSLGVQLRSQDRKQDKDSHHKSPPHWSSILSHECFSSGS